MIEYQSYHMTLNWVLFPYIMERLCRSKVQVQSHQSTLMIQVKWVSSSHHRTQKYKFLAQDVDLVRRGLESTIAKNESVGRLIADYRKSGQLTQV